MPSTSSVNNPKLLRQKAVRTYVGFTQQLIQKFLNKSQSYIHMSAYGSSGILYCHLASGRWREPTYIWKLFSSSKD
jgi:hypothetical protein